MQNAVYCDTEDPHHSVRVVEGGAAGGGDLLVVSGEEHDQGIRPEAYVNVYNRCIPSVWLPFIAHACLHSLPDFGRTVCQHTNSLSLCKLGVHAVIFVPGM